MGILRTYEVQQTHKMRYVAAYLLSALGGNDSPSTDDIKTILESVGVGYDDEIAALVVKQCAGKSIAELIAAGSERWHPCQLEVVVVVVLQLLHLVEMHLLLPKRRKRRRKLNQKNLDLMMIWVSDFLIRIQIVAYGGRI